MQRQAKDRKWQALTGDKILGQVQLPDTMLLAIELEGFSWRTSPTRKPSGVGTRRSARPKC